MKTEQEITKIVTAHAGYKLNIAKYATWMKNDKLEGFEIVLGKLKTFWVKDMQKVYEAPSDVWREVVDEVLDIPVPVPVPVPSQKLPEAPQQSEQTEQLPEATAKGATHEGIVPDTLTVPLLEKWKKMSTFERLLMFQNTPADRIDERKGFKKPDGSYEMLKYVKGNFMLQEANIAFLFNWSSKIEGINVGQTAVAVYGSIFVEIEGKTIVRACVGVDEINSRVTVQHAIKNATTDMIKKGFASLGMNGDVYRGEV